MFGFFKNDNNTEMNNSTRRTVSDVMGGRIDENVEVLKNLREKNLADAESRKSQKEQEISEHKQFMETVEQEHQRKLRELERELESFEREVGEAERWLTIFGEVTTKDHTNDKD